jgi:hypothetical protein
VNRNYQYLSPHKMVAWKHLLALLIIGLLGSISVQAQTEDPPPMEDVDTTETITTIEVGPVETVEGDAATVQFLPLSEMDSLRLNLRKVPDSVVTGLQEQDAFWYANETIRKKKPAQEKENIKYSSIQNNAWFSNLLWVLIIGAFLAVVIYYMAESGLFRRRIKIKADQGQDLEEMPEDIFAINYQKEIDKAVAVGDYRLAVRLQYLRLLKHMTEKNMIRYQQDKTNMDYLMQLHNTTFYHDFFRITLHYEYSWYGRFAVSQEAYGLITRDVEQFENRS